MCQLRDGFGAAYAFADDNQILKYQSMKKEKLTYEAPVAQPFVVRFEGMICTSPWGAANQAGQNLGEDDGYTYDY